MVHPPFIAVVTERYSSYTSRCKPESLTDNRWWLSATRGKSGLRRAGCWITSSQRELKDRATEMDRRWLLTQHRQGWNRGVRDHEEHW
jgi:hypothetical protein